MLSRLLEQHGAPSSCTYPSDRMDGSCVISQATVVVTDYAVHALYETEPTDGSTRLFSSGAPDERWTREPLSAFYAAMEARDAAAKAKEVEAR